MLKKLLLFVAIIILASVCNAQINKGTILLGGDINFSAQTVEQSGIPGTQKNSYIVISPVLATAIKQNTFLGGSLSFSSGRSVNSNNDKLESNSFGAGIFMRKYKSIFKNFYAFVQAGVNITWGKSEIVASGKSYQQSFFTSLNVTPGLSIAISKKIYLETGFANVASLAFSRTKTVDNISSVPQVTINRVVQFSSSLNSISSNLYFGFRILLPK